MEARSIDLSECSAILAEAAPVFGTSDLAKHRVNQKLLILNATPPSLMESDAGRTEFRKILTAIATGDRIASRSGRTAVANACSLPNLPHCIASKKSKQSSNNKTRIPVHLATGFPNSKLVRRQG